MGSNIRGEDSEDFLTTFLGKSQKGRDNLILEATGRTALRSGDWIFIPPYNGAAVAKEVNIELGNNKKYQLYNLSDDLAQETNLAEDNPEKLDEMKQAYENIRGKMNTEVLELELK